MNRFGDLFFLDEDGAVLWLNVTDGELSEVAENADEFFARLENSVDGSDEDDSESPRIFAIVCVMAFDIVSIRPTLTECTYCASYIFKTSSNVDLESRKTA